MSELKIYNTLTRREEPFETREPGKVYIYACGLTPQAPAHVGHMRGVIVMDVIWRWLEFLGYEVHFVQNFTDIDDKIIRRSQEEGIDTQAVSEKYSRMYLEDAAALGVKLPTFVKVTEHIPEIIAMIERLIEKGYAYVVDGDVYYSVEKFQEYGKLSGRSPDEMQAGARIEVDERKANPLDFALWKAAKPGEPAWNSPWGPGRPGWHIECSALGLKYLGPDFDIHAGGMDLIFPHHENEIAQSEGYLDNQQFVRYWLHWGAVQLKQEKMSKSVGNVISIRELREQYEPGVIRFYLLSKAYRTPIEFSLDQLEDSKAALERVRTAVQRAQAWLRTYPTPEPDPEATNAYRERFTAAMNNDFNTARALSVAFELIGEVNEQLSSAGLSGQLQEPAKMAGLLEGLRWMMEEILGIPLASAPTQRDEVLEQLMEKVIEWRQELRVRRLFDLADRVRDDLKSLGIILEDGVQGTTWRRG